MKEYKTPEGYLKYIEDELENANWHNQIEIPRNLYKKILKLMDNEDGISNEDVARIIAQEFYNSI